MKRYLILFLMLVSTTASFAASSWQEIKDKAFEPGDTNWATKHQDYVDTQNDVLSVSINPNGTLKSTTTASQWFVCCTSVTWLTTTSFKVPDADGSSFETGQKVLVNQAIDVIGVVASISSTGGETTIVLSNIVLDSDNSTSSTLTDPITSVSTSLVTPRSDTLGGGLLSIQVFTSSGTWTKPDGCSKIIVEVQAGGGGGGAGNGTTGGGGGGAGGYAKEFIDVSGTSSETVTVGAAGTAGAGAAGGAGGSSSFAAFLSATGGAGGSYGSSILRGAGGAGSGGDLNITQAGSFASGGDGGTSFFGEGASRESAAGGDDAEPYGAGGAGGYTNTSANGGAGKAGIVIIKEYR